MAVKIRFERGQEDRVSQDYGPYPFVQLTYEDLRVGPDGEHLASLLDGYWHIGASIEEGWSDVVIWDEAS